MKVHMFFKKWVSIISLFIAMFLMMHSGVYMLEHSLINPSRYAFYFIPEFIIAISIMFCAVHLQAKIDAEKRKNYYNKYNNQDNAKVISFYEKHPRVRKMKLNEKSILLFINSKIWFHIERLEDNNILVTTPPYKSLKREQANVQFIPKTTLEDLNSRII